MRPRKEKDDLHFDFAHQSHMNSNFKTQKDHLRNSQLPTIRDGSHSNPTTKAKSVHGDENAHNMAPHTHITCKRPLDTESSRSTTTISMSTNTR